MVVIPDHLHCIWSVPLDDGDSSTRWRLIKIALTRHCQDALQRRLDAAGQKQGEPAVWLRGFWEHQIHDETDFGRSVKAVVYAPDSGCELMGFEGIGRE